MDELDEIGVLVDNQSSGLGEIIWMSTMVAFFALLLVVVIMLIRGLQKTQQSSLREELAFESELLNTIAIDPPPPSSPPPAPALPSQPTQDLSAATNPPQSPEELARRLTALRIIGPQEGRVPLSLLPDGLIHRLQAGGLCAIIPRQESEPAMVHLCRRFDMVFVMTQDGEVLVYQRLQGRLPELTGGFGL